MDQKEHNEELLAKWLEGKSTPAENEQLRKEYDLDQIKNAAAAVEKLPLPDYDPESEWISLQKKIPVSRNPITRRLWTMVSIAAAGALIVGTFFWLRQPDVIKITSTNSNLIEHQLPDQSTVTLFGDGNIIYNPKNWKDQRKVQLEGDAFFDVSSSGLFDVETSYGIVSVLGTEFSIESQEEGLIVKCFEGSVKVTSRDLENVVLNAGDGVVVQESLKPMHTVLSTAPWMTEETSFSDASLEDVALAVEEIYGYEVILVNLTDERFTGPVLHQDLNNALKLICEPLTLQYEISEELNQVRIFTK